MIVEDVARPAWPSEAPRAAGPGGLLQIQGNVVSRAMRGGALAQAAWRGPHEVLLRAEAESEAAAAAALERMRFVLALDDDLEPFHRAFRSDPLLGRFIRARPRLRVLRKPEPFEALAWAICEQLIDTQAAGDTAPGTPDRRRLEAIPGVGEWTLAHLDLFGRGVYDVPLARDVGMRNADARIAGRRTGSVTEEEFAAALDVYRPWQGLAAMYIVSAGWRSGSRWSQSPDALRRR